MAVNPEPPAPHADELSEMAIEELDAACGLRWVELKAVTPWGDTYEGMAPSGRTVEIERRQIAGRGREATRIEAAHDGYAARFGLTHQRILTLSGDGTELAGEDILVPSSKNGKRGKIAFAIRFHLGRGVEVQLSGDKRGASLLLPDGRLWQFRLGGDRAGAGEITLSAEDSLWVDGEGRPHATEQLVIEGLALRSGSQFSWLLKKTG